jgi:YD repeat-containing protein
LSNSSLSYTYDAAGNVASIKSSNANGVWASYTYDDMGRLGTVVDNRLQGQQTTTYSYDAASNLATAAYPNNSISNPSAFTYDSLNRLTALASPVSSYNYTLGATGNRTKATEQGGRTLNWSYDGIYRLTNETITADPANKDGVVSLYPRLRRQPEGDRLHAQRRQLRRHIQLQHRRRVIDGCVR